MNGKRNGLIILGVFLLILVVGGVTYAFFSYSRIGEENTIVTGSLYLNFEQENQIVLDTLFPENEVTARSHNDNVIEFTINGYTETIDQDIIYGIMLEDGDSQDGKTRIDSESIRFDLDETVGGVTRRLIDSARYEDYKDGYIYVDRVLGRKSVVKGIGMPFTRIGNEEIMLGSVITSLTLKDTITDEMVEECIMSFPSLGGTDLEVISFCQGTGTWNGATIYEMAENDPSWLVFEKMPSYIESREYKYYKLKDTITQDMIDECSDIGKSWDWDDGETAESYCSGTGTNWGSTLQMDFVSDVGWFSFWFPNYIEEVPSSQVYMKEARLKTPITEEMVESCEEYFAFMPEEALGPGESIEEFCRGIGSVGGATIEDVYEEAGPIDFQDMFPDYLEWLTPSKTYTESEEIERTYKLRIWIDDGITISDTDESADYTTDEWPNLYASIKIRVDGDFLEKEQMEPISDYTDAACFIFRESKDLKYDGVEIIDYDSSCGSDISIPSKVLYSAQNPNCDPKMLGCLPLPPVEMDVVGIAEDAFYFKGIKNITIPSSVEYIGNYAFSENPLENVTIKGSPIIYGQGTFAPKQYSNPNYDYTRNFKTFSYSGTCSMLDETGGGWIFYNEFPNKIITSDTNNCILTEADMK